MMKLLLCLLLAGLVVVHAAPLKEERTNLRRLLDELRNRKEAADKRVSVDWGNELDTDEGFQINATWVIPAIQDWLNDVFTNSGEGDGGWLNDLFTHSSEEDNKPAVPPKREDKTEQKRHQKRHEVSPLIKARHQVAKPVQKRHRVSPPDNLEDAKEDFQQAFEGQSGSGGLPTFLELIPTLLGGDMEGVKQDWENTDSADVGSGEPGFEAWFNDIDWEGIVADWMQEIEDYFSGSGMPEMNIPEQKPTKYYRKSADLQNEMSKTNPNYQQYWGDIDWAGINTAIQQAVDKAKEQHE